MGDRWQEGAVRLSGVEQGSETSPAELATRGIVHRRTRPYRPQSNCKAERPNWTLADETLYACRFRSENERRRRLDRWIHDYNLHRNHTAIGGPPATRVDNLTGSYS